MDIFIINGKTVNIFQSTARRVPIIYLNTFSDQSQ